MKIKDKFGNVQLIKGFVFKSVFADRPDLTKLLLEAMLGIEINDIVEVQREREFEPRHDRAAGGIDIFARASDGARYDL